jgi:hypothetical protein
MGDADGGGEGRGACQKCNVRYHPFLRFLAAVVLGVQQKMTFRFAPPTYVQSVPMLLSHVLIRETYC